MQDALCAAARQGNGFVGGEQRYISAFQFTLNGQPFVRAAGDAGDAGDAFADHHVEPAAGVCSFGQ